VHQEVALLEVGEQRLAEGGQGQGQGQGQGRPGMTRPRTAAYPRCSQRTSGDWRFVSEAGRTFTDSGSQPYH
jgi:hypothetical protein